MMAVTVSKVTVKTIMVTNDGSDDGGRDGEDSGGDGGNHDGSDDGDDEGPRGQKSFSQTFVQLLEWRLTQYAPFINTF